MELIHPNEVEVGDLIWKEQLEVIEVKKLSISTAITAKFNTEKFNGSAQWLLENWQLIEITRNSVTN